MGWLDGWKYRLPVKVFEKSGQTLTSYQLKVVLTAENFDFSMAKPDGSDIRFTLGDGVTLIPHYIEEWDSANRKATVWVRIPELPALGELDLYIYYGNPNEEDASNGDEVFILFDDFDGTLLDATKWVNVSGGGASVTVSNGTLTLTPDGTHRAYIRSYKEFDDNIIVEMRSWIGDTTGAQNIAVRWDGNHTASYDRPTNAIYYDTYGTTPHIIKFVNASNVLNVTTSALSSPTSPSVIALGFHGCSSENCTAKAYQNGILMGTLNVGSCPSGLYIGVSSREKGSATYVDWVRVRKWVAVEPAVWIVKHKAQVNSEYGWSQFLNIYVWNGEEWLPVKNAYVWDGTQWVAILRDWSLDYGGHYGVNSDLQSQITWPAPTIRDDLQSQVAWPAPTVKDDLQSQMVWSAPTVITQFTFTTS